MNAMEHIPDDARIWIYQSTRPFTVTEVELITSKLKSFINQWAAHGHKLSADFRIEKNQFIVIVVDENFSQASGCSIDASVGVIREIEQETSLSLLDRSKVAYLEGEKVKIKAFNEVKSSVETGEIKPDTKIFNNAMDRGAQWKTSWLQPAGESWMSRYFNG